MASERKIVAENLRRVLLREFLMHETKRAGFGGLDIQRTPMGTRVTLIAERPGLVIGRKGGAIKALTEAVARDFSFDNPQIEVQEVDHPALNAQIMSEKLANALERGWHFRRAGHSTLRRVMESGAKGCLIVVAGKLTGQRHRTVKFKAGHIKYCGEPRNQWMRRGFAIARLKPGVIGVTVEIMDPVARLPDEIQVKTPSVATPPPPPPDTAPEEEPAEPVPKGKVAVRKLKKEIQKLRQIGADAGVALPEKEAEEGPPEDPEEES
ncbi:MAG TPA: 30S ribosomal protein S3 [Thermoplasmata archaeon]|uniref:Small ribosomal subunit protein uS3 n=1 Tax=uncultured euryarchaeote Rifle_16ft_4_minimus_37789 TaxID=1665195 RepID=A0A0H4T5A5_9EURY|nr:30S ribosomal protein S3P [uncultured euryarchaeote Rifle_16ft_4_minimus_37789]HKZ63687.1 30S ribosomal protein S3 [Thermoplasmata archaeon]